MHETDILQKLKAGYSFSWPVDESMNRNKAEPSGQDRFIRYGPFAGQ